MTIDELNRLQRDVEDLARRRASAGVGEAAAFDETLVFFRRLAGLARKEIAQGSEVEPRLSSGLRTLAAMLLGPAANPAPDSPAEGARADGGGLLVWPRLHQ
jgi:hypothetical protein